MTFGIDDAALVGEHRDIAGSEVIGVGHFLLQPPGIFAASAVVVVAAAAPIHVGGVDEVTVGVDERTVAASVTGDLRVAVEFAAHNLQLVGAERDAIVMHGADLAALGNRIVVGRGWFLRRRGT